MEYSGIKRDTLFLLADNRFRDSKAFYEEHKEEIKAGITVPMRQIAGIIGNQLAKLDPVMVTNPVRMVSRIRRDTRYTHDKSLYRENMWIMFMRDKHAWTGYPCFWFEVTPRNYSLGVGFFGAGSAQMKTFREELAARKDEFLKAASKCEKQGGLLWGDEYKRSMPGCPAGLEKYYNRKDFGYIIYKDTLEDLESEEIITYLQKAYKSLSPMFTFMLSVADKYYSKEE